MATPKKTTVAKPAAVKPAAKKPAEPKKAAEKPAAGPSVKLEAGAKAPAFSLPDQDGKQVSLADFKGKKVVLFFYPKDDTPGCTREACSFQENEGALKKKGAIVLGVSRDGAASHVKFRGKYNLAFPLLSDPGLDVHQAYGAYGEKTMYGKKVLGVIRTTAVIDEKGAIVKVFPGVKVDGHADKVLAVL